MDFNTAPIGNSQSIACDWTRALAFSLP